MNLFYLLILFWIHGPAANKVDHRFSKYEDCLVSKNIATEKLLVGPSDVTKYKDYTFRLNKYYEIVYPIAVFTPAHASDVQSAVICGVENEIQLVPISGGHSYASLSCGTNDSILIDFRLMNSISTVDANMVVTVGPGAIIGHLYHKLWKEGRFGASVGACMTVAMGGFVLGGGIGYFGSRYGLVIDNLVEINMVDAGGNEVVVNPTTNKDLWWALRGVGPGYIGIITSIKLKVFKAEDLKLAYVKIRFDNRHFKNVMKSYLKWMEWVKEHQENITSLILVRSDNYKGKQGKPERKGIVVQIVKVQDPQNEVPDFIQEALRIFVHGSELYSLHITFPNFINFLSKVSFTSSETFQSKWTNDEKHEFYSTFTREKNDAQQFRARSFFVKPPWKAVYGADSFDEAQKYLLEMPTTCGLLINSEPGVSGQRQANDSAYIHRDAAFNFKVYFEVTREEDLEPSENWMNRFYESVEFMDSGETFQNYPDRSMKNYLRRYYGANLEQLVKIKQKWDPNHYFNSTMSLPINLTESVSFNSD